MNEIDLSLKLRRLAAWLDGRCQPDSLVRKQLHGAPFGDCYVTIDPDREGPFASSNLNRVYLCGAGAGSGPDSVGRLIELFTAEGVRRFFVWLSPGPDMDAMRGWLGEGGLSGIRSTGYPTLCRDRRSPVEFKTDFDVHEVSTDDIELARDQLGDTLSPEYARSAGEDGFFHYMALDGRPPGGVDLLWLFVEA